MNRKKIILSLLFFSVSLLFLFSNDGNCSVITKERFESFLLNYDVIIKGRIVEIIPTTLDKRRAFGYVTDKDVGSSVVTKLIIEVEEVIAGEYSKSLVELILREGMLDGKSTFLAGSKPLEFTANDRLVVCFVPDTFGMGDNVLTNRESIFRIDGDNIVPYQIESVLTFDNPWQVIEQIAKKRRFESLFSRADVVCMGTVTKLIDPSKPSRRIIVAPKEFYKGSYAEDRITVDVSNILQPFAQLESGFKVLLFLQRDGLFYKPVAGVNGYYTMDGENLVRGHNRPLQKTFGDLKNEISIWKESE